MNIVFASHNQGKIEELSALVKPLDITIVPQSAYQITDIEETGLSFVENAILKARNACEKTGLPAIADDSGLEVFALHGAPGIYSARYAGKNANADANIKKLLFDLKNVPTEKRDARFFCALVFMSHAQDPTPLICEAWWEGTILLEPTGSKGFGYDPIFYDPKEYCVAAELSLHQKNSLSHRGKALRLLLEKLPLKIKQDML